MLYFNKNSVLQFTDWGGEWYLLQITQIFLVEFTFPWLNSSPGAFKTWHLHTVCLLAQNPGTQLCAKGVLSTWIVQFISNERMLVLLRAPSQDVNHFVQVGGFHIPFPPELRGLVAQTCRGSWTCAEWIQVNRLSSVLQGAGAEGGWGVSREGRGSLQASSWAVGWRKGVGRALHLLFLCLCDLTMCW